MKDCPADILSRAVKDLIDAYKTAWAGVRNRTKPRWSKKRQKKWRRNKKLQKPPFNFRYKSKRDTSDSIGLEGKKSVMLSDDRKTIHLFAGKSKFKHALKNLELSEALTQPIGACVRISHFCGRWYLLVPLKQTVQNTVASHRLTTQEPRIVALDPGARSMLTYFSANDQEWGDMGCEDEVTAKMSKVQAKQDALAELMKSQRQHGEHTKHKKIRRAWYRQMARAKNLMTDLHYKIIKWLTTNYDIIISPKFSTSGMQAKGTTVLSKQTRQTFRWLSHYTFRQRLLNKAAELGKIVIDVHEADTTKGCSACGYRKTDVGRSKVYQCNACGCKRPRDMNSSVAIYLKALYGASI